MHRAAGEDSYDPDASGTDKAKQGQQQQQQGDISGRFSLPPPAEIDYPPPRLAGGWPPEGTASVTRKAGKLGKASVGFGEMPEGAGPRQLLLGGDY